MGLLLILALTTAFRAGSQIINGGFDYFTPSVSSCTDVYGWNSSHNIQWESQWNNDGDGWWLDLTGCGWGNGHWVEQSVVTYPGQVYRLTFDLGCWNGLCYTNAGVDVSINGNFVNHFEHEDFTGNALNWRKFSFCFVAESALTTLRFTGNGAGTSMTQSWANPVENYIGVIGLDNVDLELEQLEIVSTGYCAPANLYTNLTGGYVDWYFGGDPVGSGELFTATQPGIYKCVYRTECGIYEDEIEIKDCKDTCRTGAAFKIAARDLNKPDVYCAGEWLIFEGFSQSGIPLEYSWDFGDGQTFPFNTSGTAYHKFYNPGVYTVCMTVRNWYPDHIALCEPVTICKTIRVVDCEGLSDTPGSDGKSAEIQLPYPDLNAYPNPVSDQLTLKGLIAEDNPVDLKIYKVTGEVVMEKTVDPGQIEVSLNLKSLKQGVYVLKIKGTNYSSELRIVKS